MTSELSYDYTVGGKREKKSEDNNKWDEKIHTHTIHTLSGNITILLSFLLISEVLFITGQIGTAFYYSCGSRRSGTVSSTRHARIRVVRR